MERVDQCSKMWSTKGSMQCRVASWKSEQRDPVPSSAFTYRHVMAEIEVQVLKLKAKELLGPQKVEEASKDHPLEASFRGSTALPTS